MIREDYSAVVLVWSSVLFSLALAGALHLSAGTPLRVPLTFATPLLVVVQVVAVFAYLVRDRRPWRTS